MSAIEGGPSSTLPPLRSLDSLSESRLLSIIENLTTLYCPLSVSLRFRLSGESKKLGNAALRSATLQQVDSGYATGTEDGDEDGDNSPSENLAALREDPFELSFVERWLTGLIARVEELSCLSSEEARQSALDQACCVLESLHADEKIDVKVSEDGDDEKYLRQFSFELANSKSTDKSAPVQVQLNDGLSGTTSSDCTDVGLQSWGASIMFSEIACREPDRFDLCHAVLGSSPHIIELGAGTGLVSLVLGLMLPRLEVNNATVIATDYHPAVLENLRSNIAANFQSDSIPVKACFLDWSSPSLEPPLDVPADMLLATDVVYAPEHAVWLRDCATCLLAAHGIFWLVATVRQNGRFEGVSDTVEAAFAAEDRPCGKDGRRLTIVQTERLDKRSGIGRGDESGYKLFRIEWV